MISRILQPARFIDNNFVASQEKEVMMAIVAYLVNGDRLIDFMLLSDNYEKGEDTFLYFFNFQ